MKRLYLLLAIIVAAFNLRPIITSVGPLLGTLQRELDMSGVVVSLLTTLPVLCMGIFAPTATRLNDRFGLERTIFFAIAIIAVGTVARGIIHSVFVLVVSAFIGGIGISISGPLISSFIKKHFPTRPSVVSYYTAALTVGAVLASAFSVPIYRGSGNNLALALGCWSLIAVAALFIWSVLLSDKGQHVTVSSRSKLPLSNKRAILLTSFFGLMASIFYSMLAWISPIAISYGYSQTNAAVLLSIFVIVQIPISFIIPSLASRWGKCRRLLISCSVSELIGISMLLLGWPMLPVVILLGIGAGGLFSLALMLPIVETATAEEAGAWSAMSQGGGYIVGAMGPLLVGYIYDWTGSFTLALLVILIMIILMIVVQSFMIDRLDERQMLEIGKG